MTALRHILYIDDEPDICAVVQITLENGGGFNVMTANSAAETWRLLEKWSPDLIVLDVMMPEVDGPTLLKQLRDNPQFRDMPVIFMTAKSQPAELESLRALGALDVIVKPFDPLALPVQIRNIWLRKNKATEKLPE